MIKKVLSGKTLIITLRNSEYTSSEGKARFRSVKIDLPGDFDIGQHEQIQECTLLIDKVKEINIDTNPFGEIFPKSAKKIIIN